MSDPTSDIAPETKRRALIEAAALLIVPASIVILLVVIGTGWLVWQDARDRSATNRMLIERLEAAENHGASADKLLCQGINAERKILADLIRSVIAARETEASRRQATLFFADALVALEPRNCDKLPSSG
jgi:hypothetical protein